jgi:hypothetical protein
MWNVPEGTPIFLSPFGGFKDADAGFVAVAFFSFNRAWHGPLSGLVDDGGPAVTATIVALSTFAWELDEPPANEPVTVPPVMAKPAPDGAIVDPVTVVFTNFAPVAFHLIVEMYRAVLGGLLVNSAVQVAGVALPGWAGSFVSVILAPVTLAVTEPWLAVPEQLIDFAFALVCTGPFDANVVSGIARTAAFGSLECWDFTQLFFSDGASFAFAVMLQLTLPDVAVMVWVLADASSAEPPTRPATATAKAEAPTRVFRSMYFPPLRHRRGRCRPHLSLGRDAGRGDSPHPRRTCERR